MKSRIGSLRRIMFFIIGSFCLPFINSCTIQQELSSNFRQRTDSMSYLILKPLNLQKSSLVVQRLYPQFAQLSSNLQDTVWKHQTKFLDTLADTTFINTYYNELILQLKKSGIKVFSDNEMDDFAKAPGIKGVFRVGQLQLEEDKQKVDFSEEVNGSEELYKDLEIEVLAVNVWFEWFKNDQDSTPTKVLYAEKKISDKVDGRFFSTDVSDQYEFRFKRTDLTSSDVLKLAKLSADQNAQQLVNFLFNRFIQNSYPESEKYYGFDLDTKSLYSPEDQLQLIEIKK